MAARLGIGKVCPALEFARSEGESGRNAEAEGVVVIVWPVVLDLAADDFVRQGGERLGGDFLGERGGDGVEEEAVQRARDADGPVGERGYAEDCAVVVVRDFRIGLNCVRVLGCRAGGDAEREGRPFAERRGEELNLRGPGEDVEGAGGRFAGVEQGKGVGCRGENYRRCRETRLTQGAQDAASRRREAFGGEAVLADFGNGLDGAAALAGGEARRVDVLMRPGGAEGAA